MKSIFIGIAGGTGSGKSTLCNALMNKYPEKAGLIQLDDYFKPSSEIPKIGKYDNWDHPDSLYFNRLSRDLEKLSRGETAIINTKNKKLNPEYEDTQKRIPAEFKPKPIMLVEGYLVLHDENVRKFFTESIWLEIDHDIRWHRRVHFKYPEYEKEVLVPMHEKFVEPTKKYATQVIDVTNLSKEQVFDRAEEIIKKYL